MPPNTRQPGGHLTTGLLFVFRTLEMTIEQDPRRRVRRALLALAAIGLPAWAAAPAGPASAPRPAAPGGPAATAMLPMSPASGAHGTKPMRKRPAPPPAHLVDLNSAGAKELKTLPGIGDAEAEKIIANRPYLTKTELVSKNVLPTGSYMSLKKLVVAMPPQKARKAAARAASGPGSPHP